MAIPRPEKLSYIDEHCGTVTEVGDSIISNMHADPYFYMSGTICANCGEVPDSQCTIVETGEKLDEYCKRLKKQKGTAYHCVRWGIYVVFMLVGSVALPIMTLAKGHVPQPWNSIFGASIGGVAAFFFGRHLRLLLCKTGLI